MSENTHHHRVSTSADVASGSASWQIISIIFFNFVAYLGVGLPMAVVRGYVHGQLGYGEVVAGL
ncbi:MAG: MFS transporter, partial [Pseudogulbenkiania sp.]|nr:MFS transporter [Pseudogulbenkiania sp.]